MRVAILALLVLCAACADTAEEVLPIPASVRGASRIDRVDIILQPAAKAAAAVLDDKAVGSDGAAGQPLATLLPTAVMDEARRRGLMTGRPLALTIEIDAISAPGAGRALLGAADRLAGTVFIRDARTDDLIGQLYIDVDRRSPGLVGLAVRGGDVRTYLVTTFATRIADALALAAPRR